VGIARQISTAIFGCLSAMRGDQLLPPSERSLRPRPGLIRRLNHSHSDAAGLGTHFSFASSRDQSHPGLLDASG
jgi:hypothetical protein